MPGRRFVPILATACALLAPAASAQDVRSVPRVLLDRRLIEKTVQLTGVDDRTVMYLDATGQPRTELLTEHLAILPPADSSVLPSAVRPVGIIELTDGQRIVGELDLVRTPPPDSLIWDHVGLGPLAFKLDDVRRIQLQGGADAAAPRPDDSFDRVILINGDLLDGFVDAVSANITMTVGQSPRDIPAARIQDVLLSGGKPRPPAAGAIAWVRDGCVLACRSIQTSREGDIVLTPALSPADNAGSESPQTISMRLDDLRALAIDSAAFIPLSSLKLESQTPGPGRRWSRPVQVIEPRWSALSLADVELPGPMSVEWSLPPAAARFAADIELPRQMWTWGDCEVVVSVIFATGESELWRRRINAESPRARVISTLPAGSVRLKVQMNAGEFGAVQDKVLIRRGIISTEAR